MHPRYPRLVQSGSTAHDGRNLAAGQPLGSSLLLQFILLFGVSHSRLIPDVVESGRRFCETKAVDASLSGLMSRTIHQRWYKVYGAPELGSCCGDGIVACRWLAWQVEVSSGRNRWLTWSLGRQRSRARLCGEYCRSSDFCSAAQERALETNLPRDMP